MSSKYKPCFFVVTTEDSANADAFRRIKQQNIKARCLMAILLFFFEASYFFDLGNVCL